MAQTVISDGSVYNECVCITAVFFRMDETGGRCNLCFPLCAGDALPSLKALRDAGRFVGKEDTVPVRLLYSRHSHSQLEHDELSTRVKVSSGSTQVATHGVFIPCCRDVCLSERSVFMEAARCLF